MLATAAAPAATLYERDGILLEGTVRREQREAGVCHVLEERESVANDGRTKANDGQGLHVWRVDFAARNGSGTKPEILTAQLSIASEWPPCTNWSSSTGIHYGWGNRLCACGRSGEPRVTSVDRCAWSCVARHVC